MPDIVKILSDYGALGIVAFCIYAFIKIADKLVTAAIETLNRMSATLSELGKKHEAQSEKNIAALTALELGVRSLGRDAQEKTTTIAQQLGSAITGCEYAICTEVKELKARVGDVERNVIRTIQGRSIFDTDTPPPSSPEPHSTRPVT